MNEKAIYEIGELIHVRYSTLGGKLKPGGIIGSPEFQHFKKKYPELCRIALEGKNVEGGEYYLLKDSSIIFVVEWRSRLPHRLQKILILRLKPNGDFVGEETTNKKLEPLIKQEIKQEEIMILLQDTLRNFSNKKELKAPDPEKSRFYRGY